MIALVPLPWFLGLACFMFFTGVFGALTRRNAVGILVSIELMLNGVNLTLASFARFLPAGADGATPLAGQMLVVFVIALAAAAAAVGLAIVLAVFRSFSSIDSQQINIMRW